MIYLYFKNALSGHHWLEKSAPITHELVYMMLYKFKFVTFLNSKITLSITNMVVTGNM